MSRRDLWQNDSFRQNLWIGLGVASVAFVISLMPARLSAEETELLAMVTSAEVASDTHVLAVAVTGDLAADELIRLTAETLLSDIRDNKERYAQDPSDLYIKIHDWVFPHFDFPRISRYVLGNAWKQATVDVQQRFAAEFSTLMLHTYGSALLAVQDERLEYLPFSANADAAMVTVKTELHSADGSVAPIDYRMGNHTGQWKVLDIKIDGISLVKTYRSEYGSVVKRKGMDQLIEALAERNRRNL